MARVQIEIHDATRVGDLSRFLLLLGMLGIDPEGDHPIKTSAAGITTAIAVTAGDEQADD